MNLDNLQLSDALYATCISDDFIACANLDLLYRCQILVDTSSGYITNFFRKGLKRDPEQARHIFEQLCDGGNGEACFNLALLSLRKIPETMKVADLAKLFERGCDLGFAKSCRWYQKFSDG